MAEGKGWAEAPDISGKAPEHKIAASKNALDTTLRRPMKLQTGASPELSALMDNADILIIDIPDNFAPMTESLLSAKTVYQELLLPKNKINFELIQNEVNKLKNSSEISSTELAKIQTLKGDNSFKTKLNELGSRIIKLEQKTFLTSANELKERKKAVLSAVKIMRNASLWGISVNDTDFSNFKKSILTTELEVKKVADAFKIPINDKAEDSIKKQAIGTGETRVKTPKDKYDETYVYLTNNPNEGGAKINLGEEEIVSEKEFSSFKSPSGSTQYLTLVKTKIKAGGSRHIIKIGSINVAGALLDKNNKITATYVDAYLRGTDVLDKLILSVNIF